GAVRGRRPVATRPGGACDEKDLDCKRSGPLPPPRKVAMNLDTPLVSELESGDADAHRQAPARLKIIDGDVHPALRTPADLKPYLSARWGAHFQTYAGARRRGRR